MLIRTKLYELDQVIKKDKSIDQFGKDLNGHKIVVIQLNQKQILVAKLSVFSRVVRLFLSLIGKNNQYINRLMKKKISSRKSNFNLPDGKMILDVCQKKEEPLFSIIQNTYANTIHESVDSKPKSSNSEGIVQKTDLPKNDSSQLNLNREASYSKSSKPAKGSINNQEEPKKISTLDQLLSHTDKDQDGTYPIDFSKVSSKNIDDVICFQNDQVKDHLDSDGIAFFEKNTAVGLIKLTKDVMNSKEISGSQELKSYSIQGVTHVEKGEESGWIYSEFSVDSYGKFTVRENGTRDTVHTFDNLEQVFNYHHKGEWYQGDFFRKMPYFILFAKGGKLLKSKKI